MVEMHLDSRLLLNAKGHPLLKQSQCLCQGEKHKKKEVSHKDVQTNESQARKFWRMLTPWNTRVDPATMA